MTNRNRKTETKLQQWLNHFSEGVDYGRFQRGMALYNSRQIKEFQVYPNHFECVVEDAQKEYDVQGYFKLEDGIPVLDEYEVTCSCPDGTPMCKHGVCATMYFALNELSAEQSVSDEKIKKARETLIEEPLKKLESDVELRKISVLELYEQRGSRVIENREFIDHVHSRIIEVMDELQKRNQ